jgi:hypothetical protein
VNLRYVLEVGKLRDHNNMARDLNGLKEEDNTEHVSCIKRPHSE